jgi:hypothetical protein
MLNARILSLYWDNIDPRLVAAQKAVWDAMGFPVNQHRIHGIDHGEWIDWNMGRLTDADVFLFVDIDCIPLSRDRVMEKMQNAASGVLVGAEGAANHLDSTRSYAGAWYVFINRSRWEAMGKPSARATRQADVCQSWTDAWRQNNAPVELIAPSHCMQPKWNLPGRALAYGLGTTYGEDCYHLFESRGQHPDLFLDKCRDVLDAA